MTLHLKPALALLAIPILNLALSETQGQYSTGTFVLTMVAYVIGLIAALAPNLRINLASTRKRSVDGIILAATALVLAGAATQVAGVAFPDVKWASDQFLPVSIFGFVLIVATTLLGWRELVSAGPSYSRQLVPILLALILVNGFAIRGLAIKASPEPIVDVYNLLRASANSILEGENPYARDYDSPYHTERAKRYGLYFPEHPLRVPGYPPLAYLLCAIPRLFQSDVRWIHTFFEMAAAVSLFAIARRRGRPFFGLIAAAMYLHLPRTPFIAEQTWTEPLINGLLGLGFVLTEFSGPSRILGHVSFGLAFTLKQFGLPMFLPFAWAFRRQWHLVALGLAIGIAIILPWFLWSPHDFIKIVITDHLEKAPGFHSVTIISACADLFHSYPKPWTLWLICGPLLLWIARRTPEAGPTAALGVGTALMTYVVFSPVGFINYFLPVQYLWLMGAIAWTPSEPEEPKTPIYTIPPLPVGPFLAMLAVVILNLGTLPMWGFYSLWAFVAVVAAFVASAVACRASIPEEIEKWSVELVGVCCLLGLTACFFTGLWYPDNDEVAGRISIVSSINFAIILCLGTGMIAADSTWNDAMRRLRYLILALVLGGGLMLGWATIAASPEPVVDVYNLLRDNADHIIDGQNPYANDIVSPYGTPRAKRFDVGEGPDPRPAGYPPLPLLFSIPPRLIGADVRWSNVGAIMIAATAIVIVGFRRNRALLGLLVAAVFLNLPRTPFVIEQAWYEPMIAALLGVGLVLTECSGWKSTLGYVLLGLGLTAKQFGLPLLLPLGWAKRDKWRQVLFGLFVGGLVILPWLVWSPRDFIDIVFKKHLNRPPQSHSITVGSFLTNEFGVPLDKEIGWRVAGVALLAISVTTPRRGAATALGLGCALLAFCIFHTQGFPNYFYLVQYLFLLGFVGILPPRDATHEPIRSAA